MDLKVLIAELRGKVDDHELGAENGLLQQSVPEFFIGHDALI